MKPLTRVRTLFGFLRLHRHELFDEAFQEQLTERPTEEICRKAGIPLLLAPSIEAGLDLDWSDPKQKALGIQMPEQQVSSLQQWVDRHVDDVVEQPLRPYLHLHAWNGISTRNA